MTRDNSDTNPEGEAQFCGFFYVVPRCLQALLLTDVWQESAPKTSYPMSCSFQWKAENLRLLSWVGLGVWDPPPVGVILLQSALCIISRWFELWVKLSSALSSARLTWSFSRCKPQQSVNRCLKQNELLQRCRCALEMRGGRRGISHPVTSSWWSDSWIMGWGCSYACLISTT